MREADAIRARLAALKPNERLFRINAGTGWCGSSMSRRADMLVIKNPRPLHAAPIGWGDLCGWESVVVTPEMVGQKVAVFVFEEFKCTGTLRPEQRAFKNCLEAMGGIYREVRPNG